MRRKYSKIVMHFFGASKSYGMLALVGMFGWLVMLSNRQLLLVRPRLFRVSKHLVQLERPLCKRMVEPWLAIQSFVVRRSSIAAVADIAAIVMGLKRCHLKLLCME